MEVEASIETHKKGTEEEGKHIRIWTGLVNANIAVNDYTWKENQKLFDS